MAMNKKEDSLQQQRIAMMRRKLKFRAWHMGTRELDFLCGRFADAHLGIMDLEELNDFAQMLKIPDRDLQDLFLSTEPLDSLAKLELLSSHKKMLMQVRNYHYFGADG